MHLQLIDSQKLKSLVNYCFCLNYRKPTRQQVRVPLPVLVAYPNMSMIQSHADQTPCVMVFGL